MELGRWRGGGAGGREKHAQNLLHTKIFFSVKKRKAKKKQKKKSNKFKGKKANKGKGMSSF